MEESKIDSNDIVGNNESFPDDTKEQKEVVKQSTQDEDPEHNYDAVLPDLLGKMTHALSILDTFQYNLEAMYNGKEESDEDYGLGSDKSGNIP